MAPYWRWIKKSPDCRATMTNELRHRATNLQISVLSAMRKKLKGQLSPQCGPLTIAVHRKLASFVMMSAISPVADGKTRQ